MTAIDDITAGYNQAAREAAPKTLVSKLAAVMAAVERVPKRGRNEFHKYDYATEADIVSVVRTELANRHVMLIPQVDNHERHDITTKKNERGDPITILHMRFTFMDGESGESITLPWIGCGQDGGDKGVYKAMTGGVKYALMKMFLMPTGDDPENDHREARKAERAADREAKAQQRDDHRRMAELARPVATDADEYTREVILREGKTPELITEQQRKQLQLVASAAGWRTEDVKRLLAHHGFDRSNKVTVDKFELLVDALKNGAALAVQPTVGEVAPENAQVI